MKTLIIVLLMAGAAWGQTTTEGPPMPYNLMAPNSTSDIGGKQATNYNPLTSGTTSTKYGVMTLPSEKPPSTKPLEIPNYEYPAKSQITELPYGNWSYTTESKPHTIGEASEYQKNFQMEDGYYIIKVKYDSMWCSIPAVVGAVPHYQAEFSVYQIIDSKEFLIGKPLLGTFTFFKCFEDVPKEIIKRAKEDK
jgi:hypothetical protein